MKKVIVAVFCLVSMPAFAAKAQVKPVATKQPAVIKNIVEKSAKTAAIRGAITILKRFAIVREFGAPQARDVAKATSKNISGGEKLFTITTNTGEQVQLKTVKVKGGWSPARFGDVGGLPDNS